MISNNLTICKILQQHNVFEESSQNMNKNKRNQQTMFSNFLDKCTTLVELF